MTLIINPGSRLPKEPQGWTNTYVQARKNAQEWLDVMRREGIAADIELIDSAEPPEDNGRWPFWFRHTVTGVTRTLEIHGIDDLAAYQKQAIFPPRIYWNGSSSSNPELADFAAPGYVQTFRPDAQR